LEPIELDRVFVAALGLGVRDVRDSMQQNHHPILIKSLKGFIVEGRLIVA
jgi:hypothetical protein